MSNEIKEKALEFAIMAHNGQKRKSSPEEPMIFHPIIAGRILEHYGFDDNVVAAAYLHDVVEDTKYGEDDILSLFGDDIASLVMGASEPDKSLSWEERKQHTIEFTKTLDLRHKAVICADKIANLEDLEIQFGKSGQQNFCAFKRGFNEQKWYFESMYDSLIFNENSDNVLFSRLKRAIDIIFRNEKYNSDAYEYLSPSQYRNLEYLHFCKAKLMKYKQVMGSTDPYTVEFTGTPRTGKTSTINNLIDFFKKSGFDIKLLEEFTTSKEYKEEIKPSLENATSYEKCLLIPSIVAQKLTDLQSKHPDIILEDRGLFDRMIWIERLRQKGEITETQYDEYMKSAIPLVKANTNLVIATYAFPSVSLKRDYVAYLSLEERSFINLQNISEYNHALGRTLQLARDNGIPCYLIDTNKSTINDTVMEAAHVVVGNLKPYYLEKAKEYVKRS